MGMAAVLAASSAGYVNAGTVEFLVDADRNFYFLEMNTRLQVEHPVTELVTGIDLVHWQIRIAAGERLTLKQKDIRWTGAALECRIYAEDPENQFFPSPGKITHMERPTGPGIRLDSGVYPGWTVPIDYDPLLAKLAVWADNRDGAIARMRRALAEYTIVGIKTNLSFFREVLADAAFRSGQLHTGFIDEFLEKPAGGMPVDSELEEIAAIVAAFHCASQSSAVEPPTGNGSPWKMMGRTSQLR
jgi:acetyl-CoA carboxylase biotin carboxylase subunit